MGKKVRYSKTLSYFWDVYHKYYSNMGLKPESLYVKMKRDINIEYPPNAMHVENQRQILGTELWYKEFMGEVTHLFFLDKELKDFLSDMKLSDLEGIKEFLRKNGEVEEVSVIKTKQIEKIVMYNFSIHIPYEKDGYSFALGLDEDLKVSLLFCKGNNLSVIPEDHYSELEKNEEKIGKFNAKTFRLAINILAYLSCFPECVKDGVPDNFNETKEQGFNKIIKLSDKVTEINSGDKNGKKNMPHFRIGHFRLLRSDYYKNKKGDLVWVHETMVKGRAKTIHTSDDLVELKEKA